MKNSIFKRTVWGIVLIMLFLISPAVYAWLGKKDNKPMAELELMNNEELADEAFNVCLGGIVFLRGGDPFQGRDAFDYLVLVGRIYRKRLGHDLDSMGHMITAMTKGLHEETKPAMDACRRALDELRLEISKPIKDK